MASQEMSFENADGRQMSAYTISSGELKKKKNPKYCTVSTTTIFQTPVQ